MIKIITSIKHNIQERNIIKAMLNIINSNSQP